MRRGTAVSIAAALVTGALVYTAYTSRESLDEFRSSRRAGGEIRLRRRPSPGPGLLTEAPATTRPSAAPRPRPSPVARAEPSEPARPGYPRDSRCGYFASLGADGSPERFDRMLLETMAADWPRDGSLELFAALEGGDWREVADLERTYPSAAASELALLARTNFFGTGGNEFAGADGRDASLDPRDLDAIAEMRARDPGNAFWPLMEAELKRREGSLDDRDALLAEAAAAPTYRNPATSFYADVRRRALAQPDDRTYLAFLALYSRAPIVSGGFLQNLFRDAGKSPERDEMLKWIGVTMEKSQYGGMPGQTKVDGLDGSYFDAWMGNALARKATGRGPASPEERAAFGRRFGIPQENEAFDALVGGECDEEKVREMIAGLRARAAGAAR